MIRCPTCSQTYPFDAAICPKCGFHPSTVLGFQAWATELARSSSGFKAEYFANLVTLEADSFWFCGRNALIHWAYRKYFPHSQSFCEVGCGTGFVLSSLANAFPAARMVGSEIFSEGLEFAARRVPTAQFIQMDARRIPYEEEFDVIGAFDVLEHIAEDESVLKQMYRAVRPGGGLLLTVPQHQGLWSASDDYAHHVRRYAAGELQRKVVNAGFRVVRATSFVTTLLPLMWVSRTRSRRQTTFDPNAEFRMPRAVNNALGFMLGVERFCIRLGISFPVGGSRLVVAQKS